VTTTGTSNGVGAGTFTTQAFDNYTLNVVATGGTFTLALNTGGANVGGGTTGPLPFNVSAQALQQALIALDLNPGGSQPYGSNINVSNPSTGVYNIQFNGTAPGLTVNSFTANGSLLTGAAGSGVGTTILAPLPFNATAAQVQAALGSLPAVGAANVTVTGAGTTASPFLITFASSVPVGSMSTNLGTLAGLTSPALPLTSPLAYNPSTATLQAAIEALSPSFVGKVVVTQNAPGLGNNDGSPYIITFDPTIASQIQGFTVQPGSGVSASVSLAGGGANSQFDDVAAGGAAGTPTINVVGTSANETFTADGANSRFLFNNATGFDALTMSNVSTLQYTDSGGTDTINVLSGPPVTITQSGNDILVVNSGATTTVNTVNGSNATMTANNSGTLTINPGLGGAPTYTIAGTGATTVNASTGTDNVILQGTAPVTINSGGIGIYNVALNTPTAGTFTLAVSSQTGGVQTTSALAFNATPAAVQAALTALSNVGAGNATVTAGSGGTTYVISFSTVVAATLSVNPVTIASSLTGGTGAATVAAAAGSGVTNVTADNTATGNVNTGTNNGTVNTTTVTGQFNVALNSPTGGTFTVVVATTAGLPQTTTALPFNSSAAAVQTAIQALSNVGAGNATVTAGSNGNTYFITFPGAMSATLAAVNPVTLGVGSLTGTLTAPTVTAAGGGVVNVNQGGFYTATVSGASAGTFVMTATTLGATGSTQSTVAGNHFQFRITGATGGLYTLTVTTTGSVGGTQTTAGIPFNATTNDITAALAALTNIANPGNILTTQLADGTFDVNMTGNNATAFTAQSSLTNGSITTQAPLPFNATAAQVQTALQFLSNIGSGGVTVAQPTTATSYTITFSGAVAPKLPFTGALTIDGTGLVGTLPSVLAGQTGAYTASSFISNAAGGTFKLIVNNGNGVATTAPLAFNANAAAVNSALAALPNVGGAANVFVSGAGTSANPFSVTFDSSTPANQTGLALNSYNIDGTGLVGTSGTPPSRRRSSPAARPSI